MNAKTIGWKVLDTGQPHNLKVPHHRLLNNCQGKICLYRLPYFVRQSFLPCLLDIQVSSNAHILGLFFCWLVCILLIKLYKFLHTLDIVMQISLQSLWPVCVTLCDKFNTFPPVLWIVHTATYVFFWRLDSIELAFLRRTVSTGLNFWKIQATDWCSLLSMSSCGFKRLSSFMWKPLSTAPTVKICYLKNIW